MKLALVRAGIILSFGALLQACGGGGGSGGPGPGTAPRMSVDNTNITVAASPGDETPRGQVNVTVTNPPQGNLYVGAAYTTNGIAGLDFFSSSASAGQLQIYFLAPASVPNGTYDDTVELHVCTDEACNDDIAGSPVTIRTRYTISGSRSVSIDRTSIEFRTDTQNDEFRIETVALTIPNQPFGGAYIETQETGNSVSWIELQAVDQNHFNVQIEYLSGKSLRPGVYDDTITINVYYDNSRSRHLDGSPLTITSHVTVDTGGEPGVEPLQVLSRTALPHNVTDAEYSKSLDAVVMASTWPVDALYVYDVDAGTERQQALATAPKSVSISPDGRTAAAGHDGHISVVDLVQAGMPGAPVPTILDVSTNVFDLVLDGRGKVHALATLATWQRIHSVDIATNTEQVSGRELYGGSLGRLHPSGDFIYTADNGLSPSDIQKWDVTSGAGVYVSDSPYHGDFAMCGNVWFREDGDRIYTACGNSFRSSTDPAQDMTYAGAMELFAPRSYDWLIKSLSHSGATGEIALVEAETYPCEHVPPEAGACYTHLATYESEFLNRQAVFAIGPVTVGERSYPQRGLFVFHDAAGSRKILLSKLDGMTQPDTEYYLSIVD